MAEEGLCWKCARYAEGLLREGKIAGVYPWDHCNHEPEKKLAEKLPREKINNSISRCSVCGGKVAYIRGKYPGHDKRRVCPTCLQEKIELINDMSGEDYNKPCKSID